MWQQLSAIPPHPLPTSLYPLLLSLSLSRHLYLCSTSPAHSSLRWPGRHALSSLFPPWLLAPLQHPSVPLACSPLPSTHPPPLAYVSPSGARWPAWFPGCCCCCCWSSGAVCYDATALPRCTSPPPASHSPLLDNRHLVLQEKATEDSKGGTQIERERERERGGERARGRELFIQLLQFSVDLTPLLSCAAGAQRSAAQRRTSGVCVGGGRAPWRNFILLSLRFHPLFIPGTECRGAEKRRGRDWEQDLRLSCTAQCPALLKRHIRQTHTHICVDWSDQTGFRRQTHSNTYRQTDLVSWRQWTAPVRVFLVGWDQGIYFTLVWQLHCSWVSYPTLCAFSCPVIPDSSTVFLHFTRMLYFCPPLTSQLVIGWTPLLFLYIQTCFHAIKTFPLSRLLFFFFFF